MDRREFIKLGAAYFLASQIPRFVWADKATDSHWLAICLNRSKDKSLDELANAIPGKLCLIDMLSREAQMVDVPFLGHIPLQNPMNPAQLLISLKWGNVSAEIDLKQRKVVKVIEAEKTHRFFGHGQFASDGQSYFLTELNDNEKKSYLVERSSKDHRILRKISTFGSYAHDTQIDPSGKNIFVINAGRSGRKEGVEQRTATFSVIDYKTGDLVRQASFPPGQVPSHFYVLKSGEILALGGNTVGPSYISTIKENGSLSTWTLPDGLHGQAFEATQDGNVVWISFPHAKKLMRWDLNSNALLEIASVQDGAGAVLKTESNKIWLASSKSVEIYSSDTIKKEAEIKTFWSMSNHFRLIKKV